MPGLLRTGTALDTARLLWSERLLLAYFAWTGISVGWRRAGVLWPLALIDLCFVLTWILITSDRISIPRWRTVRPWLSVLMIVPAYWQADAAAVKVWQPGLERGWLALDTRLLVNWRLHTAIEVWGRAVPMALELAYVCVYLAPLMVLALVETQGDERAVERFLRPLLLGTLFAYALLPYFPTQSPRLVFPRATPAPIDTVFRHFNLWVLDRFDITTSVFPSGHVAVVWSTAFGARRALPRCKGGSAGLTVFAALVTVATVYGRYHYAVDALAGILIATAADQVAARLHDSAHEVVCRESRDIRSHATRL